MSAIMGGQGVGGIMASLTDIFAQLAYDTQTEAALLFFLIPAIFMVITGKDLNVFLRNVFENFFQIFSSKLYKN